MKTKIQHSTIKRSMGQQKRYHGSLTVGSEQAKTRFPIFILRDRILTLEQIYRDDPKKLKIINQYEPRILKATTGKKQNQLYSELIQKTR